MTWTNLLALRLIQSKKCLWVRGVIACFWIPRGKARVALTALRTPPSVIHRAWQARHLPINMLAQVSEEGWLRPIFAWKTWQSIASLSQRWSKSMTSYHVASLPRSNVRQSHLAVLPTPHQTSNNRRARSTLFRVLLRFCTLTRKNQWSWSVQRVRICIQKLSRMKSVCHRSWYLSKTQRWVKSFQRMLTSSTRRHSPRQRQEAKKNLMANAG